MTQIVKANMGYPCPAKSIAEGVINRARVKGATIIVGKDEILLLQLDSKQCPFSFLLQPVPAKQLGKYRWYRYRSLAVLALGFFKLADPSAFIQFLSDGD